MDKSSYLKTEVDYKAAYYDLYHKVAHLLVNCDSDEKTKLLRQWDNLREELPPPVLFLPLFPTKGSE
jgi:hypothetical protein